jgi:hypothetical protein
LQDLRVRLCFAVIAFDARLGPGSYLVIRRESFFHGAKRKTGMEGERGR